MDKYHIELTKDEAKLATMITFDVTEVDHEELRQACKYNVEPVLRLVESLQQRDAIPEARKKYWTDPQCNIGGGTTKSHKQVFEGNGCRGADIFQHPHFLPFLKFVLFGADLDEEVIKEFEAQVGNPEWITSGDIEPMRRCARRLTRTYGLERTRAAEEFFKLCLDMGLDVHVARSV